MSGVEVGPRPGLFANDSAYGSHRHIPILSSSSTPTNTRESDAMDITPPSSAKMLPPKTTSPDTEGASPTSTSDSAKWTGTTDRKQNDQTGADGHNKANGHHSNQNSIINAAVAAQTQAPKVVQTAFIHKLYNMLEDQGISHLISWSSSGESFVMAPTADFSKVLAQYFKHTNISSFVRQLNMYGFHKVSDVFHTGSSDQAMWEFKHGNGSFKRGDTASLREIKRRASRQALIQRDSFPAPSHKPSVSMPGTPAEPVLDPDHRLTNLEYSLHEMHARLVRSEDGNSQLSARCAWLSESLARHQQWNSELTQIVMRMTSERDPLLYRDLSNLQREIASTHIEPFDTARQPYQPPMDPLSPHQLPMDDRRGSLSSMPMQSPYRQSFARPPIPTHVALSPRRYGSISGPGPASGGYPGPPPAPSLYSPTIPTATTTPRPSISGAQYTHPGMPAPHGPHPLSAVAEPGASPVPGSLARRHTSADIRANDGWHQAQQHQAEHQQHITPGVGGVPHLPNPFTGTGGAQAEEAQQLRSSLESYQFGAPSRRATAVRSRPGSPPAPDRDVGPPPTYQQHHGPPPPIGGPFAGQGENGWSFGGAGGSTTERPRGFAQRLAEAGSAPPTRRSSMANGLQNLLNPADTAESMEDEEGAMEERKRKRLA